ncbi:NAD(P)-binding protein [Thozetella sp. PMI_491]|nr:NAD(P)-binding protein [Thozetella sp. PMI_491]
MTIIRVGLIGLSASAATSWAANAHLPYLLSERGRERYRIVALCNSSVDAAKKAIAAFNLAPETRAYGDPADLAADEDVDLVVCNTRVDKHYETVRPSVAAGKAVFSEWPLAQDAAHARELAELAKKTGARTVVGLQGRIGPVANEIRDLLEVGRIGKVLSSEFRASGGLNNRNKAPEALSYFFDRAVGGNVFTIGFAHQFDTVLSVLGKPHDAQSRLQTQRPEAHLFDAEGKVIKTIKVNTPDLILYNARVASGIASEDASLSMRWRTGQPFPDEPALVWNIVGEKGEVRVVSQDGASLGVMAFKRRVTIEVHDFESDSIQFVEWDWSMWQRELPIPARNIGAVYEAFANGEPGTYATFDDAAVRHEQLQAMFDHWDATKTA